MRILLALFVCVWASAADAQNFSDDFTRGTDPGPLSPWIAYSGTWSVTGGTLKGGTNATDGFAFAYITNSWTNYSVQARVRFSSTGADAGGIGGRYNPFSGGHYAAWISPEGSSSGSNTLQLLKFQYWLGYEYTNSTWQAIREVPLPSVGTNWHTLKLSFQGNQISVYYDSNLVTSATDIESNPFWTGGICAGMSTANTPYTMFMDDVVVTPLPTALIAVNDSYYVNQNGTLTISGTGVLNNDTPGSITNLSAVKLTNPSKGNLTFNSNGSFTYVPSNNFVGVDSFTYQVTDGATNSLPATVAIDVTPSTNIFFDNFTRTGTGNSFAPWVTGLGEWNIAGGVMLGSGTVRDYYSDAYIPGIVGDFSIQTRFQLPSGAWACGLSGRLNPITGERYVANVYPEGSPLGPTPALRLIKFHSWGTWSSTYTAMALVNLPSVGTSYHTLKLAFYGNTIDVYFDGTRVVHAIDNNVDDLPPYRSGAFGAHMYMYTPYQATFDDLMVTALPPFNFPPVLPVQTNLTIAPLANLIVTNTATDTDIPTNSLTYTLTGPAGATIDTNGIISWTPTLAQDLTTNLFTTVVTDFCPGATNALHLSATNSFVVIVNSQSALVLDSMALLAEGCAPTNNAVDPGETVTMRFALRNTGVVSTTNLVATLLASGGVTLPSGPQNYGSLPGGGAAVAQPFTFTAAGSCGSTITASLQLQDGPQYVGTVTVPITLGQVTTLYTQAFDTVTAPALPSGWTTAASGAESNWVTQTITNNTPPNTAFCPDVSNIGTSDLVSPSIVLPAGPAVLSFAHYYDLETNTATDGFDGGVLDIKIGNNAFADILAAGGSFAANGYDHSINSGFGNPLGGRQGWSGTSPGFVTTIVNLPTNAQNQSVQFRWRCGTDNSNGRTGWRIDSVGISGRACCANTAPFLAAQSDRTIAELTPLIVTNTATDPSAPPGSLSYSLQNPPLGASIDANGIISWTPSESQGPSTNTLTTVVTDSGLPTLSATNSFKVVVNEINVAPVLPAQTNRTIVALTPLIVTNTASDSDVPANPISYALIAAPTNAIISNAGVISWTPVVAQVPSTNLFTTVATDSNLSAVNSQHLSATNSFTVVVTAIHNGPTLAVQTNRTINEQTLLVLTNAATDNDIPPRKLTYGLLNPPSGAAIDTNGVITWTPSELQGPATNAITTVVTDDGTPQLRATNSFSVIVHEINVAPVLPAQADRTIAGLTTLTVTNTATDSDVPTNALSYSLVGAPANAVIDSTGIISWTPEVAQVPSTNEFTTVVTDFNPSAVNAQHLSATNSFTVVVASIHNGPVLSFQTNRTIDELTTVVVTNTAADSDIPARKLTYELLNAPLGAEIDTNGVISWSPTEAQGPSTNLLTTVVTDDGNPQLSATNTFTVVVNEVNTPPSLPSQANRTIAGLTALIVTNTATDSDLPANALTYSLMTGPANASIDEAGVISWTPTAGQVPSTNIFMTVVTDFNPSAINAHQLSATNSFTVVVDAIHNGPELPLRTNLTIAELTTLVVTNTAGDGDVPAHSLTYLLLDAPAGAVIDTNGVISWTPTEAQGPSTNIIITVVLDDGTPSLSATNNFTVIVEEVNSAPILPILSSLTITGLTALTVTNTASDSDLPVNSLAYSLLEAPTNALIDTDGVITWTPVIAQVPSTNSFTTVVTDFNPWAVNSQHLSATNTFTVIVNAIHNGPALPVQSNITLTEPATLVVTNTATDHDIPTLSLTYQLMNPPVGASIDSNGIITWTPTESEAPSTNVFETIVSDEPNGPALTATNSFVVIVLPPIVPPVFESISITNGDVTLIWSTVNGRNYRLQYSDDLTSTNWTDIAPDITASGTTASLITPGGESTQRFYRVFVLP
jgi:Bacterial Ig domain